MVPDEMNIWSIGDRVDVGGAHGTVMYRGEVQDTRGEWLGVEWDEPVRGKHCGNHQGISYFTTRHPTSGSFVRPAKVSPPTTCVEAIKRRYGLIEENAGVDMESIAQVQKDIRAKFFQVVGAEKINKKQSQFKRLEVVSLRDELIKDGGPGGELRLLCPNIKELDLSKNLISTWKAAADIAGQLSMLHLLNLSENRFKICDPVAENAFESVEHLILARNEMTWDEIVECCGCIPNIKFLQVPFNRIINLTVVDNILSKLTSMDLEGNNIGDWSEIIKLGTLEHLSSLNVTACSLKHVYFPETVDDQTTLFPSLQHLAISENDIEDWGSISELDKLSSLKDLRVVKNPFLQKEDTATNHQLIVARIAKLSVLNGQVILAEERRGAELDFLKRHGREYLKLKLDCEKLKFRQKYPCYQRFVKNFGPPEESELPSAPVTLKSSLITIELFSPREDRLVKKKVPGNMTIQKLVGLVQRIFDTGSQVPTMFYIHSTAEIELDNEMKDLNFYSVEDGSKIDVRW